MQLDVSSEERNWGMAAHLSALVAVAGLPFGHVLGPLIVYLIKGHESEFVASHAKASLNYQITMSIVGIVGMLVLVGFGLGFAATSPFQDTSGLSALGLSASGRRSPSSSWRYCCSRSSSSSQPRLPQAKAGVTPTRSPSAFFVRSAPQC